MTGADAPDARNHTGWLEGDESNGVPFDVVPVPLYATDRAGVIRQFNRRAADLWGREPSPGDTAETFCGEHTLFHPDGTPMPYAECPMGLVATGASAEVRDAEVTLQRPDGARVTAVVNSLAWKNARGEVIGAVHCFFDVTQRTQDEEALRQADRQKTEFLAMLAHELRNPLAPILVSLDLLRRARPSDSTPSPIHEGSDGGRAAYALTVLTRQVAQMVRLVDDLLDAARVSLDRIEIRRELVEVSSVILAAVDAVQPLCDRHEQELTVTLPSDPIFLLGDPARLAQIAGNLLSNACKFTPRGGKIWLTVRRETDVAISVRDTGVGVPRDQLAHVFDMFTQVDGSRDRSPTGLGIGLALVKTLAEMHGGTVEAASPGVGQGSEFTVRLPLALDDPAADVRAPRPQRHD